MGISDAIFFLYFLFAIFSPEVQHIDQQNMECTFLTSICRTGAGQISDQSGH